MYNRKYELQKNLGNVIKDLRQDKSINRLANEIELSKSIWCELEKGKKDIRISTFWRIAEAFEIKPSTMLALVEKELGKDFSFLEDTSSFIK
ncbi:MAG: helix-turn-helix domain-containing protein [Candidatus Gastranaerophilales bacterium]|nr:helix-turn-helix domain-containing protein [Candidatus Gastranaerophilales bacterium]MCM1072550.1 helix-turn-helix domain-containing protein [Bacteroides sp.]